MSSAPILLPTRTTNDFIVLEKISFEPWHPLESRILRSRSLPHLSRLQPGFWIQSPPQNNTFVQSLYPEVTLGSAETRSTSSLSSDTISSIPTTNSIESCATAAALLQDSPSYRDNIEDAQCLVYCSQADCLPRLELDTHTPKVMLDIQRDEFEVPRACPIRIRRHFSQYQVDNFSSNRAIPARPPLPRASIVLPQVSVPAQVSQLFSFATLAESIALFSGDLAASMVAMCQNHYGVSSWKQVQMGDRRRSIAKRHEWEREMRALEVDEWVCQDAC